MNTKQVLKLFAPYFAVGIFWCMLSNAWLAIFAYHAQILFWSRKSLFELRRPTHKRVILDSAVDREDSVPMLWMQSVAKKRRCTHWVHRGVFVTPSAPNDSHNGPRATAESRVMLLALPSAFAGPLVYYLLPYMTDGDLSTWMTDHHISRLSFTMMIPYFGLLHPFLEQLHWAELRENTRISHILFAGYHMIVLYSLLAIPWLIACFLVLTAASVMWQQMTKRSNSLAAAYGSHVLADLGIIMAAWFRA